MSEEHVELVRRVYEAASSREAKTVYDLYSPDVVLDASRLDLAGVAGVEGISRGHDGLKRFFREWHEAWGDIDYTYDELIEAGDDVISIVTRHARGRASGIEVERLFALLWTVRDGRVVRVVWFLSREEALEAAGLSE
jgi:ketosteroid isomerase-like protein